MKQNLYPYPAKKLKRVIIYQGIEQFLRASILIILSGRYIIRVMGYLFIILTISVVIIIHELGHLLAARLAGIQVERFSFGFGPKIASFLVKGISFRISVFPIGGYVLLKAKTEEDFFSIPVWKRILFTLGGPLFNIGFAYLLLIVYSLLIYPLNMGTILLRPFELFGTIFIQFGLALSSIFSHPEHLSGVIGIVAEGGKHFSEGIPSGLLVAVLLSINLAIINLLPLPVLDGGKIILALLEKVNPRIRKAYTVLSLAGWLLIIGLFIFTAVSDVIRIVT